MDFDQAELTFRSLAIVVRKQPLEIQVVTKMGSSMEFLPVKHILTINKDKGHI